MTLIELGWLTVTRINARFTPRPSVGSGQSTVEYALVGALVVIAAAGALTLLGGELNSVFTSITKTLRTASAGH